MFLNELFNEAVMSSTVQTRAPISPGARGLAAGRFNFNVMRNAAIGDNSVSAVEILKIRLIDSGDGEQVEEIITSVAGEQNISPENLKKLFRTRYNVTPKEWLKNYMVRFLNSPKGMVSESGVVTSKPISIMSSYMEDLWYYSSGGIADVGRRQESINEWVKNNFKNDFGWSRGYVSRQDYINVANKYKTQILTQILKQIKNGHLNSARLAINTFEKCGVDWPEFDVITKSLEMPGKITESVTSSELISTTSYYMQTLWYYSLGKWLDGPVSVRRRQESLEKWLQENFKNLRRVKAKDDYDPRESDHLYYVPRQDYINVANKYKTQILTQILTEIKNGVHVTGVEMAINDFKICGIRWPEFDVITKSLDIEKLPSITESRSPPWQDQISVMSFSLTTLWMLTGHGTDDNYSPKHKFGAWVEENFDIIEGKTKEKYISKEQFLQFAEKNKKKIITKLLSDIKNCPWLHDTMDNTIRDLWSGGINWPELDVIMKSLKRDITEGKELPVNSFALRTLWLLATNTEEKKNLYSLVGKSWVEKNFAIRDDNVSKKRYTKIADNYKKNILTKLFNNIKKGNLKSVDNIINDLESGGVMWRELQIIKKSLRMKAEKIKKSPKVIDSVRNSYVS